MKEGYVISKSVTETSDMKKINQFTRKELKEEDVYSFSVLLCDNEVDRDFERFSINALKDLAVLFVGKTGIFDHNMTTENQSARIYDCYVETDESKKTSAGEIYHRLMAKAYMPRCEKNKDLITEIESGIKKEVSVGCSVGKIICSVCGKDMRTHECDHIKGKSYSVGGKNKYAHAVLDCPTDAYEWSFVAVPAQKAAGVVKKFEINDEAPLKKFDDTSSITLSKGEAEKINMLIGSYSEKCKEVDEFKSTVKKEIVLLLKDQVKEGILKEISLLCGKLNSKELISFKQSIQKEIDGSEGEIKSQLSAVKQKNKSNRNQKFII